MQSINQKDVQAALERFADKDVYIHLETTSGAYTVGASGAYIRNSIIRFSTGKIAGEGPFRIGLKMVHGWVYAEGLTDWELDKQGRLLLAGHDEDGKLSVAFQLSLIPF